LARRIKTTRHLSRRKGSGKKGSARARNPKKMRGGVTRRRLSQLTQQDGVTRRRLSQLTQQELSTALQLLPADVVKQIGKRHPLLIPPFTNDTLRRAVQDYLAGGARKQRIRDKYGEISNWDVSNVTDMSSLFEGANSFNQPLNNWNVSNVTDMGLMFTFARSFNQPLNNWNVSKVTNMRWMFSGAEFFNQPLNNWDVSNVKNMEGMFHQQLERV
jgi:surface protein